MNRVSLLAAVVGVFSVACDQGGSLLAPPDASDVVIDFGPVGDAATVDGLVVDGSSDGVSAECGSGPCQPRVLATGSNPGGAGGLAIDDTNVYWVDTTGGRVLECAKTGCSNAPTVLASGQGSPIGIAVSEGAVYWTNASGGTVSSCSATGCGGKPMVLASGLSEPAGIAVGGGSLYWVESGTGGGVKSCLASACATPTVLASVTGLQIAVDGSSVYFTNGQALNQCPLAGCASGSPTLLFTASAATGLAIDATNAYVTTFVTTTTALEGAFQGAVLVCAKAGCAGKPTALASALPAPLPIAVSGGIVYWGNTLGDTDLLSCASTGCMATPTVVTMAALPLSLAVDGDSLYWASLGAVLTFTQ
jgi:hypothetical protein